MDEKQTAEYAARLGWTAEEDEGEIYLTNVVSGLSIPEVMLVTMPSGEAASIDFHLPMPYATSPMNQLNF